MKIIAHRGFWKSQREKNTFVAFERALKNGYGIETDIRDNNGELVISHDIPTGDELGLTEFLEYFNHLWTKETILAINIKSDGLAKNVKQVFEPYPHCQYFVFDMSFPDSFSYLNQQIPVFMRESEYEPFVSLLGDVSGVWLDQFTETWFDPTHIRVHLEEDRKLCVVSPELHGREPDNLWHTLKMFKNWDNFMICTDIPETLSRIYA